MLTSGEGGAVVLNNDKDFTKLFHKVLNRYNKLFCISDINITLLLSQI